MILLVLWLETGSVFFFAVLAIQRLSSSTYSQRCPDIYGCTLHAYVLGWTQAIQSKDVHGRSMQII